AGEEFRLRGPSAAGQSYSRRDGKAQLHKKVTMPRFIDQLRGERVSISQPWTVAPYRRGPGEQYAKQTMSILHDPDLPVLLIDNGSDYLYGCDQEYWDLTKHFPNLAPPFPRFWCESRLVKKIRSLDAGKTDMSGVVPQNGRLGVLVVAL